MATSSARCCRSQSLVVFSKWRRRRNLEVLLPLKQRLVNFRERHISTRGTPPALALPVSYYLLLVRLGWHPRQRPHLAELLPDLLPRVPTVLAPKQLAIQATGQHQVGVCGVGRETTNVAVGLAGQGQGFPGFPSVLGTLHRAYGGRRCLAMTHKYHVRVIFLHGNSTGIGMGELLHHLQALPALACVGAGEDLTRSGGEDRLGLAPPDRDAVDVRVAQPTGDGRPGIS